LSGFSLQIFFHLYFLYIQGSRLFLATYLCTQFDGPNGELGAAVRYLSQRLPTGRGKGVLTDIVAEEQ
jgi:spore coat protein JC